MDFVTMTLATLAVAVLKKGCLIGATVEPLATDRPAPSILHASLMLRRFDIFANCIEFGYNDDTLHTWYNYTV